VNSQKIREQILRNLKNDQARTKQDKADKTRTVSLFGA
jgi:hypothetical protein